jgi:hypothetical protein
MDQRLLINQTSVRLSSKGLNQSAADHLSEIRLAEVESLSAHVRSLLIWADAVSSGKVKGKRPLCAAGGEPPVGNHPPRERVVPVVLEHDDPAGGRGRLPQPVQHCVPPGPGPALGDEHLPVPYRSGGRLSRFALLSQRLRPNFIVFAPRINFSCTLSIWGASFVPFFHTCPQTFRRSHAGEKELFLGMNLFLYLIDLGSRILRFTFQFTVNVRVA